MDFGVFKTTIAQCAAQMHHRISQAEIDGLFDRMKDWPDKILIDVIQNVIDDEKKFPIWNVWNKHRNLLRGDSEVKGEERHAFYHVNDCPLCGYGAAVAWNERFDRFTEYVHVKCPMGEIKDRAIFLESYKPPEPVDVYRMIDREEMQPVPDLGMIGAIPKSIKETKAEEELEFPF